MPLEIVYSFKKKKSHLLGRGCLKRILEKNEYYKLLFFLFYVLESDVFLLLPRVGSGLSMRVPTQAFLSSLPAMVLMSGCITSQPPVPVSGIGVSSSLESSLHLTVGNSCQVN